MYSIESIFNRTHRKNLSELYSVHIRVILERKYLYLKIKHFPKLESRFWDKKRKQVSSIHPNAWQLNEILHKKKEKVNQYCLKQLMSEKELTLEGIKTYYYGKNEKLMDWAKQNIRKKNLPTYGRYEVLLNHVKRGTKNFRFDRDNLKMLKEYFENKGISDNTQAKLFSMLKTLYRDAAKDGVVQVYDEFLFDFLKFNRSKPKRTALTLDNILDLYHYSFNNDPDMNLWKDQFVFLCLTGLYYSDMKNIDVSEDLKEISKGHYITNERIKTGNTFVIPLWLWPEQMQLIDKYSGGDKIFPKFLSDQKFNQKLKIIGETLNLKITNKVGRHSFTDICIARGIPRQFVSRMLGHSNESTTQVYYEMNIEHFSKQIE